MNYNLADLFELAVDRFPDRECLVADGCRRTYAEMDERANRLAHHLAGQGIGPGDHVGIYGCNSVEWVESLWAVFKLRAVWINVNYRYVEDELAYLIGNADLKALLHQAQFSERVAGMAHALPMCEHVLVMDAPQYEEALAAQPPDRDFGPRSGDDRYILYTGGTTGLPKGVVWRHEDVFFALGGGVDARTGERVRSPSELADKAVESGFQISFFPLAPLMHGATQWGVMGQSFNGNKVVLCARFDPVEVWRVVQAERVNSIMITGDAMARPLVEILDGPGFDYDTSSLLALSSSAAVFSAAVKDRFFEHFPDLLLADAIGSSESGNNGIAFFTRGADTTMRGGPTVSPLGGSVVLDDDLKPVEPGSGKVGRVARFGNIPLEYYKDPAKTSELFVDVAGVRHVMPGDAATVEADGSLTLLGRGSQSINSGGEKVFPEEVESACKVHPAVWDATVVGVTDDRWGQRVAAVVSLRPGIDHLDLKDLQAHCRARVAGYKIPRQLHVVDEVVRSPSGKPDYRWAASVAAGPPDAVS